VTTRKVNKKTKKAKEKKPGPLIKSELFFNRDLGWLDFNARVLHEALDERTPLLERLRFMSIWRSNNDEFFMKRVGALVKKIEKGDFLNQGSGQNASALYDEILKKVASQQQQITDSFTKDLIPSLENEGIKILGWNDLDNAEKKLLLIYFKQNIFPILTPLAVDSGHPFPFISNLSKSIGVCLRKPSERAKQFARIKIPTEIPQWIPLEGNLHYDFRFINIEEIIMANLDMLFRNMKIDSSCLFRVTRNAAIDEEGDDAEDKLEWVEEGLKERKFAPVVRLEVLEGSDPWIIQFLMDELDLEDYNFFTITSFPSYTNFSEIIDIKKKKLKYPPFQQRVPTQFDHKLDGEFSLFSMIRKKDSLVHFPYESFTHSVENFVKTAANDSKVRAIKIILYRTDTDGRLIDALIEAAENKKQVAVIIELKARFDEERNIKWANKLEEAGIHVSYGLMELKTHAKMIMVVRQDTDGVRTYANIGTGNYNSQTSRLYTDYSLFTCDPEICHEVMEAFNFLTGRSLKKDYGNILVAPYTMFKTFIKLIEIEKENAKKKKPARIIAKMNQLEDPKVIKALYEASQAGVKITLLVRGFCCLRPGVKGMSENIEVFSVVGRLLEHSRIFYFQNGAKNPVDGRFFIGSADWMRRNLFDRVEVITPIKQDNLREELWDYLSLIQRDNRHLWVLKPNGEYTQRTPKSAKDEVNSQEIIINS
jgi:polyphosphate kinase